MKKILFWIIGIIVVVAIVWSIVLKPLDEDITGEVILREPEPEVTPTNQFKVIRIIDGDTIVIETNESVRLICIDTPEYNQDGYEEATKFLEDLILNKTIRLEKDVSEVGKYGRLVRYVYLPDSTFVNELIVKNGYGTAYWYEPDITLCPIIQDAEDYARDNCLGIWEKECEEDEDEKEPKENEQEEEESSELEIVCSSDYYNCGDFSLCSEVMEIFEYCGGDVHGLDGDNDGVPCETLCG